MQLHNASWAEWFKILKNSRYGCQEYFRHYKELLFYERQQEIAAELENLELDLYGRAHTQSTDLHIWPNALNKCIRIHVVQKCVKGIIHG
jgi:hypothetical protein